MRWPMGGGAELWVSLLETGEVMDANPYLDAKARMLVEVTTCVPDQAEHGLGGMVVGWADPLAGGAAPGAYPFAFDAPDFARMAMMPGQIVEVGLVGFAQSIEVQTAAVSRLPFAKPKTEATESFAPSGLFVDEGLPTLRPEARVSGHVLGVELRRNEMTGRDFWWAHVRTLGGDVELVADPATVSGDPVVGSVVVGDAWLCGRGFELTQSD